MAYTFSSRVRLSESDENGKLTLPGILDYYQDCCTFQADSIHQGAKDMKKRGRVWVLSSWQVVIERFPEEGESIIVSTMPYQLKGFFGLRNFTMDTAEGERLSYANSVWTNLNIDTGIPERLTEKDLAGYVLDEKLPMEYASRKIALLPIQKEYPPFEVQKQNLDWNHHVNNCQYIHMAMEYLPEGRIIRQLRAEYKQQAHLGDLIYPTFVRNQDIIQVQLNDASGSPYCVAEVNIDSQVNGNKGI